jgi:phage terminase large subunit-like protein
LTQPRRSRAQVLELLLGPNGEGVTAFASEDQRLQVWETIQREVSPEFASQWLVSQASPKDFPAIAEQYARDVVDGRTIACRQVQQACQRHLDDLQHAGEAWDYSFDRAKAARVCRFAELLPHVKGKWAANSELIVLQPWQVFILCSLFGWLKTSAGKRRFSLAYIEVGRKNAKSVLAAVIGDYMFAADGEFGSEVYSGATKEDQAMEVFRPAMQMIQRSPELKAMLGIDIPSETSKKMRVGEDGSRFEVVVRAPGDGASPHCGIVDEYHEHDADTLFDTFATGMAAREQPLRLVITTAGFNTAGPCMALHQDVKKMLGGLLDRPEVFAIIYSLDPDDDWTSEMALAKPNPNYGVSVSRDFLRTEQRAAIMTPRKQNVFKTKHQCVWGGANMAFFDLEKWKRLGDPSFRLDSYIGERCYAAVDLSSKRDFTARALLFQKVIQGKIHYFAFMTFYLPEARVSAPENQHYQGWAKQEYLTATPGDVIDFDLVTRETVAAVRRSLAAELAFDPWNASQLVQKVHEETDVDLVEIPQNTGRLSPPTKELDALIAEGRIHHDGNPVMAWMMGNVVGHEDANENVFPRKESGHEESKIDGAIALILALSRAMSGGQSEHSVYESRGLLVL